MRGIICISYGRQWAGRASLFTPPASAGFLVGTAETVALWVFCAKVRAVCVWNDIHSGSAPRTQTVDVTECTKQDFKWAIVVLRMVGNN